MTDKKFTITEIIHKLIGPINPIGKANIDPERLENLKLLCSVVDELVNNIADISTKNRNSYEHSVKEIGEYASNFMNETLGIK